MKSKIKIVNPHNIADLDMSNLEHLPVGEGFYLQYLGKSDKVVLVYHQDNVQTFEEVAEGIVFAYILASCVYTGCPIEEHPAIIQSKQELINKIEAA